MKLLIQRYKTCGVACSLYIAMLRGALKFMSPSAKLHQIVKINKNVCIKEELKKLVHVLIP